MTANGTTIGAWEVVDSPFKSRAPVVIEYQWPADAAVETPNASAASRKERREYKAAKGGPIS
jgi:hypothetical protein